MKIEKISERQIRCTLSKKDLVDRELRLSELAYGTDKAKELFRELMQQASCELGFEADDIPLMIEAIPVSSECLVLVVTKVDDPEELDTRFSKFTDDAIGDYECDEDDDIEDSFDDDGVINCFGKIDDLIDSADVEEDSFMPLPRATGSDSFDIATDVSKTDACEKIKRVYVFNSLEDVIKVSSIVNPNFQGNSCLYKNPSNAMYYLTLEKTVCDTESFSRICGVVSEYGQLEKTTYASFCHYEEHFKTIVPANAVEILSNM
jgi:adapter protein MecA 1/2